MKFVNEFGISDLLEPLESTADLALISHPGYFRRNVVYNFLLKTPLGTWEHRQSSSAFVPMRMRKNYVCGGMFWGRAVELYKMLQQLALSVRVDLAKGVRAKHNDESHLNKWFTDHQERCLILPPRWAFDPTYIYLKDISPIVEAVRKPRSFVRVASQ